MLTKPWPASPSCLVSATVLSSGEKAWLGTTRQQHQGQQFCQTSQGRIAESTKWKKCPVTLLLRFYKSSDWSMMERQKGNKIKGKVKNRGNDRDEGTRRVLKHQVPIINSSAVLLTERESKVQPCYPIPAPPHPGLCFAFQFLAQAKLLTHLFFLAFTLAMLAVCTLISLFKT